MYRVAPEPITGVLQAESFTGWEAQPFPVLAAAGGATLGLMNQLQQSQTNSQGVQPNYLHMKTRYDFIFQVAGINGYVEIALVEPRASGVLPRVTNQDWSLPTGLPGFCCLAEGTQEQYHLNSSHWKYKRLKRLYFNCAVNTTSSESLHTNNLRTCSITLSNPPGKRYIRSASVGAPAETITALDIPQTQQQWIIISSSIETTAVSATNNIVTTVKRCPVWRDSVGSS